MPPEAPATEARPRSRSLAGTVAVVTGTSPNIGAGIALAFAAAGAAVACLDVAADSAERCVDPFHVVMLATDALEEVRREV